MQESPANNPALYAVEASKIYKKSVHVAVVNEDLKAMRALKKNGVNINAKEHGHTPLHLAVLLRKTGAVKELVSLGANLTKVNRDGFIPLHLAAINNSVSFIRDLIDRDAGNVDTFSNDGSTALHIAIVMKNIEAAKILLEEGADSDLPNKEGIAALHVAIVQGYSDVIDLLFEYIKNPNVPNKKKYRPLHLAVMYNQINALRKIGEHEHVKVDYRNIDGDNALHIAIKMDNNEAIEELINLGANLNLKSRQGFSPIHLAVLCSSISAIGMLVVAGAHLDCIDRHGNTPLHLAVMRHDLNTLIALCSLGADRDLKNKNGNSPLLIAVLLDSCSATRILLHYGADFNVFDANGMTPLHIAACLGNNNIIQNLIQSGASLDCPDAAWNRPLHAAAELCNLVGIKTTINYKAWTSYKNSKDQTALDIVMQYVRKNTFKTAVKTVMDLYKKKKLVRKLPLNTDEILESAKIMIRFEILENFEDSKLKNPEHLSDIIPIIKSYINDCFTEVRLMKSALLHENFCLYSFVIHGWQDSMPLTCNNTSEIVLNHLLDVRTSKGYPIYRNEIFSKLVRPALLKKVRCLSIYTTHSGKAIFLNLDTVPVIVEHLSDGDICNLLLAYSEINLDVNISKSSNANKRKLNESELNSSSVNEKSKQIYRCKKTRLSIQPESSKKSRTVVVKSSDRSNSSSIVTRSKKVRITEVKNLRSSVKSGKKNCISVLDRSIQTKRASRSRNNSPRFNKVTRKNPSSAVKTIKKVSALSTRSKKGKGPSKNCKTSRRNASYRNSKNKK